MATKEEKEVKKESNVEFELGDLSLGETAVSSPVKEKVEKKEQKPVERKEVVNILRNEKVTVRHINKESDLVKNLKHVLYGGMAEGAVRVFVAPRLRSGSYVNVLTNQEKEFLEDALGMEYNALSSLKKTDNFWDTMSVRLTKEDTILDLSDPYDYIRYKVLLANKDYIASSLKALEDQPKTTYQFVLISSGEETRQAKDSMSTVMKCYKEYGKVEEDRDILRLVIETIDGRPTAPNVKLDFLQTNINRLIQSNSKLFLKVITDPMLRFKVLIKKSVENGSVINRDGHFYLRNGNLPLCEANEESTLSMAAKYISLPRHQDILFALEAKAEEK